MGKHWRRRQYHVSSPCCGFWVAFIPRRGGLLIGGACFSCRICTTPRQSRLGCVPVRGQNPGGGGGARKRHGLETMIPVTKILHWLVFILVAAQYAVGEFMPHIGRNAQDVGLIALHFSLGSAVMVAVIASLAWRIIHPVPADTLRSPAGSRSWPMGHPLGSAVADLGDDGAGLGGDKFPRVAGQPVRPRTVSAYRR